MAAQLMHQKRGEEEAHSFEKGGANRWLFQPRTQMTARVSVMCEHVHGCVELHYTSPISPSLSPGHSSVPRHKGELMKLPSVDNQGK